MTRALGIALVIASLAASVTAQEQPTTPAASDINPLVLTVNGEPVHAAEISLVMRTIASQLQSRGNQPSQKEILGAATQRVIEQKLLAQEARRFGLRADESRVQAMVAEAARELGGPEALAAWLARGGSSVEQLTEIYREIVLGQVLMAKQIRPTVQVSDKEVDDLLAQHPELSNTEEEVHARHIFIAVPEGAGADADQAALERAQAARKRALAGEDFAALARELSDGPSAANGGDLGFITRSQVPAPLASAAFALAPGEISDVVRSPSGYHVIKVEERRPAGPLPPEQARAHAHELLVNRKTAQLVSDLLKTLYDNAKVEQVQSSPSPAPDKPPSQPDAAPTPSAPTR